MTAGAIATIGNSIAAFGIIGISLRYLDASVYGLWLVLTAVMAFVQLTNLGLGPAIMKLVAEAKGCGDNCLARRYLSSALFLLLMVGMMVGLVGVLTSDSIIQLLDVEPEQMTLANALLPWVIAVTVAGLAVRSLSSALAGTGRLDLAQYFFSGSRLISVPILFIALKLDAGVYALLIASVTSIAIETGLLIRRLRKELGGAVTGRFGLREVRCLLSFGGYTALGSAFSLMLLPLNKILLSNYAGLSAVPTYEIAFTASMQLRAIFEAGLRSIIPAVSAASSRGASHVHSVMKQMLRKGFFIVITLAAPLYIAAAIMADTALRLWLGDAMHPLMPDIFRIMLAGSYCSMLSVPAYCVLMGYGFANRCMFSQAIQGIANLLMVALVIWLFGELTVASAAWATAFGMLASCIFINISSTRITYALSPRL